ncbi:YceI family protein [Porticoccaceae bacterium LTM1]|nr:YceI family protein [Porticoccaceae bacterium LTM1]
MRFIKLVAGLAVALNSAWALADWQLNNDQSNLTFVSTKAGNIAEVHHFKQLGGGISGNQANVTIDLASIDSLIPIRDDRMKAMLFNVEKFAEASISASVDMSAFEAMANGDSNQMSLDAALNLHGETSAMAIQAVATKLSDTRLMVTSWQPVIVNAATFKLAEGVEKLREVAGLPAISQSVPVSFVLVFEKK